MALSSGSLVVLVVGVLLISIAFRFGASGRASLGASFAVILVIMAPTGGAFLLLNKSNASTCNQITTGSKNGIACSSSKGRGGWVN